MDYSPWLHYDASDAHPGVFICESLVDLGAVDKAIMLAITDLESPSSVALVTQASSLLIDISTHYPILMLRHLPNLIRAMVLYIHRQSKRLPSQHPVEPLMSQGYGSCSVKVTFSVASRKDVMASQLHATWLKCLKSINTKGLNESIDAIIRKICAREGLSL